jgi:glutaredoxin
LEEAILYSSSTCPKCKVLKSKLDAAGIPYRIVMDEKAAAAGINEVPVLEVKGERMNFVEGNKWINEKKG